MKIHAHQAPATSFVKINANQAPATSFVYVFVVVNVSGERSVRLNGWSPLFKCSYMFVCLFVCLLLVHTRLFESMLMFMLECITTNETLGNSFINTDFCF